MPATRVRYNATPPTLGDGAWTDAQADSAGNLKVTSVASIPGTAATSLGKAEDAVHTSGDTGVMTLGVRSDTPASTAGTTGDYAAVTQGAFGQAWIGPVDPVTGGAISYVSTALVTGQQALSTANIQVVAANSARMFLEIKNTDASISVYIGKDASLTTANGHLLKVGEAFGFEGYTGAVFAIAASGTPTVTYIQW